MRKGVKLGGRTRWKEVRRREEDFDKVEGREEAERGTSKSYTLELEVKVRPTAVSSTSEGPLKRV